MQQHNEKGKYKYPSLKPPIQWYKDQWPVKTSDNESREGQSLSQRQVAHCLHNNFLSLMGIGTAGSIEEKIQTRQTDRQTDRQATRQTHKIMALRQDEHQSKSSIKKWYAVEHSFFKKIKKVSKQTTLKLHLRFFFFVTVYQLFHRILQCIMFIKYLISVILSFTAYQYTYTYDRKNPHNWEYYIFRKGGGY